MTDSLVISRIENGNAHLVLNRPDQRNALSIAMFEALDGALDAVANQDDPSICVLLSGCGSSFCAGFDLQSVVDDPSLMAEYIARLSRLIRKLRRLESVVVAAVQGSAIAGGCALLTGCDFVFAPADAMLGYPVHGIGVSPAVTIPTLMNAIGGAARPLLMGGQMVSGEQAHRMGLVSHLVEAGGDGVKEARRFCDHMATKGPQALRATKGWLNELDGSLDDEPFDRVVKGSQALCDDEEASRLLQAFWAQRGG